MMSTILCGADHPLIDFPDAGEGGCCMGAAVYGPDRCTCWEPVYDQEQHEVVQSEPIPRSKPCDDCAFRSDSPESNGDDRYEPYEFTPKQAFFCHGGMRRIVAYRHPTGVSVPADTEDRWKPPQIGNVVFKASGEPAEICAGWAVRKELHDRATADQGDR